MKSETNSMLLAGLILGSTLGGVGTLLSDGLSAKSSYSATKEIHRELPYELDRIPKFLLPSAREHYGHWWISELQGAGYGALIGFLYAGAVCLTKPKARKSLR